MLHRHRLHHVFHTALSCCTAAVASFASNVLTCHLCAVWPLLQLAGGCHTPKRFRSLAAGLTVLHLPPGTPANPPPRAWTPGSTRSAYSTLAGGSRVSTAASSASTAGAGGAAGTPLAPRRKELRVVASLPLSTARDTTVSFYAAAASQGGTYLLVPHAGDPGLAAPFVLRVQSSSPMQLQQLPSPLSLVIGECCDVTGVLWKDAWCGVKSEGSYQAPLQVLCQAFADW